LQFIPDYRAIGLSDQLEMSTCVYVIQRFDNSKVEYSEDVYCNVHFH